MRKTRSASSKSSRKSADTYTADKGTQDFLSLAFERFKLAETAEGRWRREALEDLEFYTGDQWPNDIRTQREKEKKPCLTTNRLHQYKNIVTNEYRQQRPAIQVNPVGDGVDKDDAEIMQGIVRHVEVNSDAEVAYDIAFEQMVITGIGWLRVITEWIPGTFKQCIKIKPIRNQFTVYSDPSVIEPDYSDSNWQFIVTDYTPEVFKKKHPNSRAASLTDFTSVGDNAKDWLTKDGVRVAEYFYVEEKEQKIYQLEDGRIVNQLGPKDKAVNERMDSVRTVNWAKITAVEVLDKKPIPCNWIPLIPVLGHDLDVNGKRHLAGLIRNAKDAQRKCNYFESAAVQQIALSPQAPFIIAEGQQEDYEEMWKNANNGLYSALIYKPVSIGGQVVKEPTRNTAEPPIQATVLMLQESQRALQAVMGMNDANLGEKKADESGILFERREKQGSLTTLNYSDNMSRTMRHVGRIVADEIPKVMDTPQIMRIIKPDGSSGHIIIHSGQDQLQDAQDLQKQNPAIQKIFDPSNGTYDVTISVGPSFQTKRQEAVASIMSFIQSAPEMFPLLGDLLVSNMDWHNAPECAKRLKLLAMSKFPFLAQDEAGQDPEARAMQTQAKLAAMSQLNEQLTAEVKRLTEMVQTKQVEQQGKYAIEELHGAVQLMVAEINTKSQELKARLAADQEAQMLAAKSAHELGMQSAAGAQAAQQQDQAHQQALEQGAQQGQIQSSLQDQAGQQALQQQQQAQQQPDQTNQS